jgi:hypothetical protein
VEEDHSISEAPDGTGFDETPEHQSFDDALADVDLDVADEPKPVRLNILPHLKDIDLMADLSIVIEGMPVGAQLSAGKNNWDGTWSLTPIHLTKLKFTAPSFGPDEYTLTVRVLSIDTDGYGIATTEALFDLTVPAFGDGSEDEEEVEGLLGTRRPSGRPRKKSAWPTRKRAGAPKSRNAKPRPKPSGRRRSSSALRRSRPSTPKRPTRASRPKSCRAGSSKRSGALSRKRDRPPRRKSGGFSRNPGKPLSRRSNASSKRPAAPPRKKSARP